MPPIRRMINPIIHRYSLNQKRINAFQASDVVTILIRVRAVLVVCVDAAPVAKMVLRCMCVELLKRQELRTLDDFKLIEFDGACFKVEINNTAQNNKHLITAFVKVQRPLKAFHYPSECGTAIHFTNRYSSKRTAGVLEFWENCVHTNLQTRYRPGYTGSEALPPTPV